jgi:GST-like protein
MIKLYFHPTPNPFKIALYLEETGTPYELIPVDTRKGDQHTPEYKKINPNSKTPSIQDGDITVFDSTAILLYLSEKIGKFLPPKTPKDRSEMHQWLMFIATGIGPYCGQSVHFKHFAPDPKEYAVNRYDFEAWRHWNIIEERLSKHPYMLGDEYGIVDIALWPWARMVPRFLNENAFEKLPNVKRFLDEVSERPAAKRALSLQTMHEFKTSLDDEARRALFPSNERLKTTGV